MMSVGMPWPEGQGVLPIPLCSGVDEDLRMCSDSDSQLELSELIESITCDDVGATEGSAVVASILDCLLDRVETVANAPSRENAQLEAREIDGDRSRDKKSYNLEPNAVISKKLRRKREHEKKKSRRRSTSCSTTSSACSDHSRKNKRKHKHHRRKEEDHSPRVNPIFLWVKQDDTRIVEVLCEDYDKRNRIRLTKTAHGWRAMPRTERLDTALSRSSLDLSPSPPPTVECLPSLVSHPQTKEKKTKRCVSRKSKRCDRKREKDFKKENFVDVCKNVDAVNNNYCNISNNNTIGDHRVVTESSISDPALRSFGYKKACHNSMKILGKKKRDNKLDDIDIYTFVDTPKTDSDVLEEDTELDREPMLEGDLKIKQEIDPPDSDNEIGSSECAHTLRKCDISNALKSEPDFVEPDTSDSTNFPMKHENTKECKVLLNPELQINSQTAENDETRDGPLKTDPFETSENCEGDPAEKHNIPTMTKDKQIPPTATAEDMIVPLFNSTNYPEPSKPVTKERDLKPDIVNAPETKKLLSQEQDLKEDVDNAPLSLKFSLQEQDKKLDSVNTLIQINPPLPNEGQKVNSVIIPGESICGTPNSSSEIIRDKPREPTVTQTNEIYPMEDVPKVESSSFESVEEREPRLVEANTPEHETDDETLQEVILPEPHLQTPEPSPQPAPEPSSVEPESSLGLVEISLQPETSLDSDTIHLPDTTTKSDSSSLISTDISLGQKLSIPKSTTDLIQDSTSLDDHLHNESKCIDHPHRGQQSQNNLKTIEMIRQEEIERQITADLDEDHLLAIEEILQGEECVEDFSDDDLPEEYTGSHDSSPVNLVLDLKSKDQVDNRGIPLSLRTDDFLEMFPTPPPPMKEHSELTSPMPLTMASNKVKEKVEKKIPHAHQQNKTKFLESILTCPKRSHKNIEKVDSSDQQEPLYLGVSRKSASPTVSSSDGRKFSSPELEPKPKRMKVEDITLKTILNRNKESYTKTKVIKSKDNEETQQTADSTTKSRLLELLTNENDEHISKMDPLTQLKEVLSDPDLNVPDPLLVPRSRLPALVANPAKEIPRLLAMKSENLSYPKLLSDPDLLVVSLSHLQSLLQAAGKEEEMLKYQQAQMLQQQMKQEQATLDAATATALNQMMWLPYLSQLEAAAMACGNTQDFMTMLNMVFPSGTYPQMANAYLMPTATSPGINAYDYKSQLEFQQAFALWNEAMMQAATNQFAAQTLATANPSSISKLYQNYQDSKYTPKSHPTAIGKHQEAKHTAARTSPISQNYQQNKYRSSNQYPYTSMFSIPTSTPSTSLPSGSSQYKTTSSVQSQPYTGRSRSYNHNSYSSLTTSAPKSEYSTISALNTPELFNRSHQPKQNISVSSNNSNKAMMSFLTKPKQPEVKSHSSKAYPTSTTLLPKETTMRITSQPIKTTSDPPKLKVKQPQHLVDPNSRPKLLNFDEHGEVGSTTGSMTPQVDETHPNLWHPLFSSQQKSYSSPWQWTTPVTVSGE